MTPEQVQQSNELIARFMGAKIVNDTDYNYVVYGFPKKEPGDCYLRQMKYHSRWEWLMPVVEKIESIQMEKHGYFGVHIHSNACTIQGTKFRSELRDEVYYFDIYSVTKLNATWHAVTQFIKWYNEQNKQP